MKKILINFAHPARARSRINNALLKAVKGLQGVTINDLYANYPDFIIDVKREQQLCMDHDVIIFQHPFYWYSYPAIVKEWQDLVLQHGWAYGTQAEGLKNKLILQAITAGANDSSYQKQGYNNFTIKELTASFRAMAKLCNMIWLPPFTVLGIHRGLPDDLLNSYAEEYKQAITALQNDKFNLKNISNSTYLNSKIDSGRRRF